MGTFPNAHSLPPKPWEFSQTLTHSRQSLDYLVKRPLTSAEAVGVFPNMKKQSIGVVGLVGVHSLYQFIVFLENDVSLHLQSRCDFP